MMGYGDFSHALFLWSTLQSQYYQGIEPKNTPKNANIGQHLIKHTIEPPIAPYCHVKPLDRQTYYQHHRRARETAHAKNGERIFCLSLPSIGAKVVFHKFVKNLNIGLSKIRHS